MFSAPVNCDSLHLPVCLSTIGGSGLLCDLTSLIELVFVYFFSSFRFFFKLHILFRSFNVSKYQAETKTSLFFKNSSMFKDL